MLVVIGIIIALVALLIPAVSHVRRKGYDSATHGTLTSISRAVDAYYDTFHDYPGPAPLDVTASTTANNKISGAQNLVLGLCYPMLADTVTTSVRVPGGGKVFRPDGTLSDIYVNPQHAEGPYNYAQKGANGRYEPLKPYITVTPKNITEPKDGDWAKGHPAGVAGAKTTYNNFNFPVFVDNYPDALPVLFYRRTPGVTGPVKLNPAAGIASYYIAENEEYTAATGLAATSGRNYDQTTTDGSTPRPRALTPQSLQAVFRDSGNTARGGYILLSAGADRAYGVTHDAGGVPDGDSDNITVIGGN
jgi:type II secretory pathway pseudopilin PulG